MEYPLVYNNTRVLHLNRLAQGVISFEMGSMIIVVAPNPVY